MISIIVAFDKNRLIGSNNALPWHIPEDLKLFKARTLGHPIILGRKTWDSLPKRPLKGRLNVIVSQTKKSLELFTEDDLSQFVYFHPDLKSAIKFATWYCPNSSETFIVGGRQIYETALKEDVVDKIYATEVHGDYEGDTFFPELGPEWKKSVLEQRQEFDVVEFTK